MLGGTFDPIHHGHLASARAVATAFSLERVLLVLSARPPHRSGRASASIEARAVMLDLATAGDPVLVASRIEVDRAGPSYTYDTMVSLSRAQPDTELHLIIGMDAFAEITSWHRSAEILERVNMIVTSRPGYADVEDVAGCVAALGGPCYDPGIGCYVHSSGHVLVLHEIDTPDISASSIRHRALEGDGPGRLAGLVPEKVGRFIDDNSLYQS